MYLKSLHIQNFRCFADYTIEFAPGVTVLFGKNGAGKSSLINGIHKALSFLMYFEEIKEKVTKGKKAKVKEVRAFRLKNPYPTVEGFSPYDCAYEGTKNSLYEINIKAQAEFEDILIHESLPLEWNMTGVMPKFVLKKAGYRSAFLELYSWAKTPNRAFQLPLLAYYSDGFPHNTVLNQSKSTEKTKREFHLRNSDPELGYTDWNTEKGYTNVWLERLRNKLDRLESIPRENQVYQELLAAGKIAKEKYDTFVTNNQEEFSACKKEVDLISSCLRSFSEGDKNFEVASLTLGIYNRTKVNMVTSNMERRAFSDLPAGYKRMFYIALDIAYRSYLLSGLTTTDISGIAIIDEIDLHLHPELEQVVLQRFMKTFPHVQFIVSTHSPLVLSGLETEGKPNKILRMVPSASAPEELHDIYGLDVNSSIEDAMGVSSKNDELDELITLCAYMRTRGKLAQAENIKQRILSQFPKNSEELEKLISLKQKEL